MIVMAGRSAGAAYAASETVTMTAIDANGVGDKWGLRDSGEKVQR